MSARAAELPFLRAVALVTTFRCPVRCTHCVVRAGPERREQIALDPAFRWIDEVASYRDGYIRLLTLTGGEPFTDLPHLRRIAEHASERGLFLSIITNGFWATTEEKAVEILTSLPKLAVLAVSADAYHQPAVPFERVIHAARAAARLGIGWGINICTDDVADPEHVVLHERLRELVGDEHIEVSVTFPGGRAAALRDELPIVPEAAIGACAYAAAPVIFPDGRVLGCMGPVIDLPPRHPLFLGSLHVNSLQEILDRAEENVVLQALRVWGPRRVVELLRERGYASVLPNEYVKDSICSACLELFSSDCILAALRELAHDEALADHVAQAREFHLNEMSPTMHPA